MLPRPPISTLFPYTTLFRSVESLTTLLWKASSRAFRSAMGRPWCLSPRHSTARLESSASERGDRKSTRLNSSHVSISYAVFCLKKKKLEIVKFEEDRGLDLP